MIGGRGVEAGPVGDLHTMRFPCRTHRRLVVYHEAQCTFSVGSDSSSVVYNCCGAEPVIE